MKPAPLFILLDANPVGWGIVLCLACALVGIIFFSGNALIRQKIRFARAKQIADFKDGDAGKVTGEVIYTGKPLVAPLSGRTCAYYYIRVSRKSNRGWFPAIEDSPVKKVLLKNGDQFVLIDTSNSKACLVTDAQYRSGIFRSATEAQSRYLAKFDFHAGYGSYKYREGILEEGEKVVVAGKGYWKNAKKLGLDIEAEKVLVMTADKFEPVYFSDDPKVTKAE